VTHTNNSLPLGRSEPCGASDGAARGFNAHASSLKNLVKPARYRHRPSRKVRTLLFHPERCSGCNLCRSVCGGRESGLPMQEEARIQVCGNTMRGGSYAFFCQHCLTPRCLPACPQGAISREKDGIVRINKALCVNCGICQQVCAESAPLRGPAGNILKCDLCAGEPRCASACPQQALEYTEGKALRWIAWLRRPVQLLCFLLLVVVLAGTVCSLSVAALDLFCPTGVLQNIASSRTLLLTSLGAGLILLALALIAGRVFCGWICPFGFVLDLVDAALGLKPPALKTTSKTKSRREKAAGFVPAKIRELSLFANRNNKYGVLAGAAAASAIAGNQAFCTVCPIGVICRSYGIQAALGGAELAVIPLVAAMDVSAKRSWCRYFCPVGAAFALVSRFAPVYIEIGAERCKKFSCKRCSEVCPAGIISETELQAGRRPLLNKAECIMCLRCVDICPHKAAKIRLGRRRRQETAIVPPAYADAPGSIVTAPLTGRAGENRA
jgi:ferredoxin-type protein NapH